ncbi:non-SMC mitotic condensation complex subunit 1-domain-containing protein [Suillus clintonianus]|uniref:non-SMC mitotic condensation complex subunit 1-domain-containing protein n=1 Tax=Suillus clintonianus TaxID=1904413 RepID=UPI001B85D555|nr:non-SMC mitotic condensation complex subunit 1-domain-containing protein [Suillus clintonianus]KAG2116173.1 non-SMC mitotic condensation complex subunit 1-domain-containing protein [Suillus clintonianus]
MQQNRTLRAAATLLFNKFLCHHLLLFKILETSRDPNIRSNIIIALGDVTVSFSNIIDENSNELYQGLSDGDLVVKKNTLMMLMHLILNGMIKVKGQLSEMAKCLENEEIRISDLAKVFFKELSTKDNAVYNNLPNVISHLKSKPKILWRSFASISDSLRIPVNGATSHSACLSSHSSKRWVKKLIEGLQSYRDKLPEEGVFDRFGEILTNLLRPNTSANKPDTELNESESILSKHRRQGEEDQAFEKRVEGRKQLGNGKLHDNPCTRKLLKPSLSQHCKPRLVNWTFARVVRPQDYLRILGVSGCMCEMCGFGADEEYKREKYEWECEAQRLRRRAFAQLHECFRRK